MKMAVMVNKLKSRFKGLFLMAYGTCKSKGTATLYSSRHFQHAIAPFLECSCPSSFEIAQAGLKVIENFVSENEESILLNDIEPKWRRLKYQEAHWDNAIQSYRETENVSWSNKSNSVISKMKSIAFRPDDVQKSLVHVLDLSPTGYILPHVDSVKFCGRVICGLSLISPCVMKFVKTEDSDIWFKALLSQRSLYIMQDSVRYDFTHEVLKNSESYFQEKHVDKRRRISVLCRSEPKLDKEIESDSSIFQSKIVSLD